MNKIIKNNEKAVIEFEVECVDTAYKALKEKGVEFINEPIDIPDWEMRYVYLRDPEGNLIALFAPLSN
jgi:predicted enzyme related to lactoylglutathione lyase